MSVTAPEHRNYGYGLHEQYNMSLDKCQKKESAFIPGIYPQSVNGKLIQKSLPMPNRAATAE
jgi:hypothetical protein